MSEKHWRYSPLVSHWNLDQNICFLNHGSFGACPQYVLNQQSAYRNQLEGEPVRFMIRELEPLWWASKKKLSEFVGAHDDNLVFVKNATQGVNTIFHSLSFNPGDEVIITSLGYGACNNTVKFYADRQGFSIKIAEIPFPIKNQDQVIDAVLQQCSPKTKLVLMDHVTSASGIILPVEKLIPELHRQGIMVLVDGAHAPGMLDLNLEKLGADFYTGNCHKWICSPKGSAFLHVAPEHQDKIFPLQISHRYDRPEKKSSWWAAQFFWPGTDDYTPYLCVKDAIEWGENILPGGWEELKSKNRSLCLAARKTVHEKLKLSYCAPEEMLANLCTMSLGVGQRSTFSFNNTSGLQDELYQLYRIEIPVMQFPGSPQKLFTRFAVQLYNDISQYQYLTDALAEAGYSSNDIR